MTLKKSPHLTRKMAKLLEKLVVTGDQALKTGEVGTGYLIPITEKDPRWWFR